MGRWRRSSSGPGSPVSGADSVSHRRLPNTSSGNMLSPARNPFGQRGFSSSAASTVRLLAVAGSRRMPGTQATDMPAHLETPTGLRVRSDLYDEEYSDSEYQDMLALYEGTMSQIVEGEIVKSKILRITDNAVILDVGFKSE